MKPNHRWIYGYLQYLPSPCVRTLSNPLNPSACNRGPFGGRLVPCEQCTWSLSLDSRLSPVPTSDPCQGGPHHHLALVLVDRRSNEIQNKIMFQGNTFRHVCLGGGHQHSFYDVGLSCLLGRVTWPPWHLGCLFLLAPSIQASRGAAHGRHEALMSHLGT